MRFDRNSLPTFMLWFESSFEYVPMNVCDMFADRKFQ